MWGRLWISHERIEKLQTGSDYGLSQSTGEWLCTCCSWKWHELATAWRDRPVPTTHTCFNWHAMCAVGQCRCQIPSGNTTLSQWWALAKPVGSAAQPHNWWNLVTRCFDITPYIPTSIWYTGHSDWPRRLAVCAAGPCRCQIPSSYTNLVWRWRGFAYPA